MEEIKLKSDKRYIKVTTQLEEMGYTVRSKCIPKLLAQKGGKTFWVMITPLHQGGVLMEEQMDTIEMIKEEPDVLVVRMP